MALQCLTHPAMAFLATFLFAWPCLAGVQFRKACYRPDMHYIFLTDRECPPSRAYIVAGKARFDDQIDSVGWSFLEIETNGNLSNNVQAYVAGVLEGNITHPLIMKHWKNTYASYCHKASDYCDQLFDFLNDNLHWMYYTALAMKSEQYWDQVHNMLIQLTGLEDGYFNTITMPHFDVSTLGFLLLEMGGDLEDLQHKFKRPAHLRSIHFGCSALVKPLQKKRDILTSHVTWSGYETMMRVQKLYNMPYSYDGKKVPGWAISTSSYPAVLLSIDDFYITSASLVITETTFGNANATSYQFITPYTVPSWIRSMVANRLSKTGKEWAYYFSQYQSGTYTNQWMVVDYKAIPTDLFHAEYENVLHVLEETPGFIMVKDMTKVLYEQNYWPSYNVPYFPEIFNYTGQTEDVQKYGDWFTYERNPRALIFKRDHGRVTDMPSLIKLMRYNNFKEDPLSACNCTPPYSAENAISARNDLNDPKGVYPFKALGHRAHGGTDMKATNFELVKYLRFTAISGPTYDQQPAFQWSTSYWAKALPHYGHPDVFDFTAVTYTWHFI